MKFCFIWKYMLYTLIPFSSHTLRCKSQFTNNMDLIFWFWSKSYFSFHPIVFSFLVSYKCPRQKKIFSLNLLNSDFFLSCLALVSSSFLFKFYTKQHSKVAGTKLHTAISYIILLEWEKRLEELIHLSWLAQQRQNVSWFLVGVQFVSADCIRNQQLLSVWQSFLSLLKKA